MTKELFSHRASASCRGIMAELTERDFIYIRDGKTTVTKLADIQEIRLRVFPRPFDAKNSRFAMITLRGGHQIWLNAHSHTLLGPVEDRSTAYAHFMRVLIERAASQNSDLKLRSGCAHAEGMCLSTIALFGMVAGFFGLGLATPALLGTGTGGYVGLGLASVGLLAACAFKGELKQKAFRPDTIPEDYLMAA